MTVLRPHPQLKRDPLASRSTHTKIRDLTLFGRLSKALRKKLEGFDESGMGYWRVKAKLRDGRIFTNVYITDLFTLAFPDLTPFRAGDIVDIEWDGYRGAASSGTPVEITE